MFRKQYDVTWRDANFAERRNIKVGVTQTNGRRVPIFLVDTWKLTS